MKKILLFGLIVSAFAPLNLFAQNAGAFVTIWNSTPASASSDHEIRFCGIGNGYTLHWEEVGNAAHSGMITAGNIAEDQYLVVDFTSPGQYKVWVDPAETGTFDQFKQVEDRDKLIAVTQWGNTEWSSFYQAFRSCPNLDVTATDVPDLTKVTDMEDMFAFCTSLVANSSIDTWNTSHITNMTGLFRGALKFNQSLNSWNTSSVTTMHEMFAGASAFNGNITGWNTSAVTDMALMFASAGSFNQPIGSWDTHSVQTISAMFENTQNFNQSLEGWNTANVTDMTLVFQSAQAFNSGLNTWDLSKVTSLESMFNGARVFNQPLDNWNTGHITSFANLFSSAISFNQNINKWDVSKVTSFRAMFEQALSFNQPLDNWNTASATDMGLLFHSATLFNQNINSWDMSHVTTIEGMFEGATSFNQPVNDWNTINITAMSNAFHGATNFNQPLSDWNMTSVMGLNSFLDQATAFNQDISKWNNNGFGNSGNLQLYSFLNNSGMDCVNYSLFLNALAANTSLPSSVGMDANEIVYNSSAQAAHDYLTTTKSWTINGDVYVADCHGTLPVTLEMFKAVFEAPFTVVQWITGVDDDLAYFEVQRSLNGKDFATVKKVAKQGEGQVYQCRLEGPEGVSYYRLKIVETSGKITYSETRGVHTFSGDTEAFRLYPNPVRSNTLHVLSSRMTEVTIFNQLGQQVGRYSLEEGDNRISVAELASGVYWLREINPKGKSGDRAVHQKDTAGGTASLKFIIQH